MIEGGRALVCVRCHAAVGEEHDECLRCGGPVTMPHRIALPAQRGPAPPGWLQPIRGLGTALVWLLAVAVLVDMVAATTDVARVALLGRVVSGEPVSDADLARSDDVYALVAGVQALVLLATAVVLIIWLQRAYQNAARLGSVLPHGAGWTIGAWFVPILNLVRPKQLVDQAWQASDPQLDHHQDALAWRHAPRTPLVTLWWSLWLSSFVATGIANAFDRRVGGTDGDLLVSTRWITVGDALDGLAALALLLVVRRLTARQSARLAAVGV